MNTPLIHQMAKDYEEDRQFRISVRKEQFKERNAHRMNKIIELTEKGWRGWEISRLLGIKQSTLESLRFRMRKNGIVFKSFPRGRAHPRYGIEKTIGISDEDANKIDNGTSFVS